MQGAQCPSPASEPPKSKDFKTHASSIYTAKEKQSKASNLNEIKMETTQPATFNLTKEESKKSVGAKQRQSKSIDSDNRSDCSPSPASDYFEEKCSSCSICGMSFASSNDFTDHHKCHVETGTPRDNKGYLCKLCGKIFNSSIGLERHAEVHCGERPFRCKICDLSFDTVTKMHCHERSHKYLGKEDGSYESDESSTSSSGGDRVQREHTQRFAKKRPNMEYNNNGKTEGRKKARTINNNFMKELTSQGLSCPVCERDDFITINALETHLEENHPEHQIQCALCNVTFKNYQAYNIHRLMVHYADRMNLEHSTVSRNPESRSFAGFNDLTFIDFSSQKFPQIASTVCGQSMHKSVSDQLFTCRTCSRDFPCKSALDIHRQTCFLESKTEISDFIMKKRNISESTEEDIKQKDFFAKLDLQNKSVENSPQIDRTRLETRMPRLQKELMFPNKDYIRPSVDATKDLADIQSIINVTSSGGLLEQLTSKTHDPNLITPPDMMIKENEGEETQDQFAAEFRKMKLRGEFPCRLCPAKFPNLRALKGHNRVHLSGNGPGPYRCNMCPHSSLDKAALIRHMRTHNGDRPYECAVCHYAFTTKANCERHLRNRHSKVTREDVKRSIIYHPSEDPNNDEVNTKLNISREEIKRSLVFNTPPDSDRREDTERNIGDRTTPLSHYTREQPLPFVKEKTFNLQIPRDLSIIIPQPRDILRGHIIDSPSKTPQEEPVMPRIKVKGIGQLTQIPEFQDTTIDHGDDSEEELTNGLYDRSMNFSSDVPIDLSTTDNNEDVLDLSKKKNYPDSDTHTDTDQEQYSQLELHENSTAASMIEKSQQFLLAQQHLLNNVQMPKLDPATAFFTSQLSQIYRSGITGIPGLGLPTSFPINPYLLQQNPFLTPPSNSQDLADMKERIQKEMMIIRGLQMSGGGLVNMDPTNLVNNMAFASDRLQAMHQHSLNNVSPVPEIPKAQTPVPTIKIEDDKPLHINTESSNSTPFSQALLNAPKLQKRESITSHSPNSVKMVIKNGVLMPKQKQRRYRTERPFSCEHCSARFTLRSNMERHIKQQHPQYWSQRQRANIGNFPRKPSLTMVPQNMSVPNLTYDSRLQFLKNMSENGTLNVDTKDYLPGLPNSQAETPHNKPYLMSDQMKYALLAQQLNNHQNLFSAPPPEYSHDGESVKGEEMELEEEEDALVIDEEEESHELNKIDENNSPPSLMVESNSAAKKVAEEILLGVSAKQHDLTKDFDLKITGNLISKNRLQNVSSAIIPTLVSQFDKSKHEVEKNSVDITTGNSSSKEEGDLVPVSRLLDNAASQLPFGQYFKPSTPEDKSSSETFISATVVPLGEGSEEDEEGLVASSGSTIEGNSSGSDENRYESDAANQPPAKKKSAYSLAPNRVSCPYCHRKFPWSSSLRRHVLTHTGQKPFKCPHCPLLFTTKSNCDRHLLRKHGGQGGTATPNNVMNSPPHFQENPTPTFPANCNIIPIPGMGSHGFMMRNVPERPYKCASCPSSTFSTLSNLKKHMSLKHGIVIPDSHPTSPLHENEEHFTSDDEKMFRSVEEQGTKTFDSSKNSSVTDSSGQKSEWELQVAANKLASGENLGNVTQQNSELPFKCHLCDGSYGERHEALDHIKGCHASEYELLMSKGALETNSSMEENVAGNKSESCEEQNEENIDSLRGKFPDYANRKVVCAFCMRRFWSAEDLRRHMRTHTGERPFSCDICRRRFTLKHSMLRHRKKHQENTAICTSGEDFSPTSGDEDVNPSFGSPQTNRYSSLIIKTSTPISKPVTLNGYQFAVSNKNVSISPEIPSNVNNNNSPPSYEDDRLKIKIEPRILNDRRFSDENLENGNDLIGNLLGISDRGMINKLLSSPDEAAKLLGVNK